METGIFEAKQDDTPFDDMLDPVNTWTPKYETVKEALNNLSAWTPSVMEYNPKKQAYDPLLWNSDWLDRAYLVIDDPRTMAVLEYAMQFGMIRAPFRTTSSTLALNTLPAVYNMGYMDQIMSWAGTSDAAQFRIYMGTIFQLLQKLNATTSIARGVTDLEVAILLSYMKGKNSDQEHSLWPSQVLLEQYSLHVRGYLSNGASTVLEYLSNRILVEKIYNWRTKAKWKAYLWGGAKGLYAPTVIPSKVDFKEGWRILDNSFPVNWQYVAVSKIVLPEVFDPHLYRN
ncbi:hypothetical protein DFH08DRAFT_821781 [Mycena albidolilacea]|uniref:Uncharacterized protein n=1 Tax=Mycena albidolilacea TaxID=1033008 RepID=A0AAD7EDY2_9AGAR|nr:hypothetical protein DFH08DRAFT_821781 [Mycena albidolilacea]